MDDLLKNLTIGFFAFVIVHGGLEQRARHAATRQISEAFDHTGKIWTRVEPRGMFSLTVNDMWAVDIYGVGTVSDRLPFYVYPRSGWKGSIRHLRLHLKDFTLAGLPIERFEADIPFATYDIGHAFWKERLHLRSAGVGPGEVEIGPKGLQIFLLKKFNKILSDVEVSFPNQRLLLSGHVTFLSGPTPFTATGLLKARDSRFIDLIDPDFRFNGVPLNSITTALLLKQINPVLDAETDLRIGNFFTMTDVTIGERSLTVHGRFTIPPEKK